MERVSKEYIVRCIMDDGDMKLCIGEERCETKPDEGTVNRIMQMHPEAGFAVIEEK